MEVIIIQGIPMPCLWRRVFQKLMWNDPQNIIDTEMCVSCSHLKGEKMMILVCVCLCAHTSAYPINAHMLRWAYNNARKIQKKLLKW